MSDTGAIDISRSSYDSNSNCKSTSTVRHYFQARSIATAAVAHVAHSSGNSHANGNSNGDSNSNSNKNNNSNSENNTDNSPSSHQIVTSGC